MPSPQSETGTRRPPTSTTSRTGLVAGVAPGATPSPPEASQRPSASACSTQLVVAVASMNSGVSSTHWWKGIVDGMPSTTISSSARSIRLRAASRSAPHVTSLPNIES